MHRCLFQLKSSNTIKQYNLSKRVHSRYKIYRVDIYQYLRNAANDGVDAADRGRCVILPVREGVPENDRITN
jgi:hypothetical protein